MYNTKEYFISFIVGSSRRGWLALCVTSREIDCKPRICVLGAVHMSRASPSNRADLSHENLYFSTT